MCFLLPWTVRCGRCLGLPSRAGRGCFIRGTLCLCISECGFASLLFLVFFRDGRHSKERCAAPAVQGPSGRVMNRLDMVAALRFVPRGLRDMTVTYSRSDVLAVSLIGGVVAVWAAVAERAFSVRALVACEAMF